ncbi:MAG: RDD family protein [Pirellulales bacterium]|nr:RDD family protein [Pirellulales bacterium]
MPAETLQIDSRIEIITPENIAFQYRLAGPFRRFFAFKLDLLIRLSLFLGILLCGFFLSIGLQNPVFVAAFLCLGWFGISWFYGGIFETYWNGQTPGKWAGGLRVVGVRGQPIQAWQAVLRNILREVDLLPVIPPVFLPMYTELAAEGTVLPPIFPLGLVGIFCCALSSKFQRLGDLASGTIVIVEDAGMQAGLTMLKEPAALAVAADLPPNIRVSRQLARTLAMYVQRRLMFTPPRRAELARRLADALRWRNRIRPDLSDDLLLCGLYIRTFIADAAGAEQAQQQLQLAARLAAAGQRNPPVVGGPPWQQGRS